MPLLDISTRRLRATSPARRWKVDVDVSAAQGANGAPPEWVPVMGRTDTNMNPGTAGLQADSDYDSGGFTSQTATSMDHGGTFTVRRAPTQADPTAYDPGQEFIRGRARSTGPDNTLHYRFYEELGPQNPRVESYEAYGATTWADSGGDQTALSMATITLTGQGVCLPVPHPAGVAVGAPTVSLVRYATAAGFAPVAGSTTPVAGGGLLYVSGTGFTTATGVTVFGNVVPAGDWDAVTDGVIAVKAPAHAAGTGDVVVVGTGGTSGTSAATKVTYA